MGYDGYYKALVRLPSDRLAAALADEAGRGHAWFDKQVWGYKKDSDKGVASSDSDEGVAVPSAPLALPPPLIVLAEEESILPRSVAASVGYSRVKCDVGDGTPVRKVYFTHDGRSAQRGFIDYTRHTCIKYRTVGCDSKEWFCALLYLWETEGCIKFLDDQRCKHLEWEPSHDAIQDVCRRLRMTDF